MKHKFLFSLFSVFVMMFGAWQPVSAIPRQSNPPPQNVAAQAWSAAENGTADVIVYGAGYPDLSPARSLITKEAKTKFVFDALSAHAQSSLAALRGALTRRGVAFEALWIINALAVKNADQSLLRELAARPDVRQIDLDAKFSGVEGKMQNPAWSAYRKPFVFSPQTVTWGVDRVNAPLVWAMGYRGAGIVVAGLDTGIAWAHPAIKAEYRGWDGITATHDYNWFDPVALSPIPLDDNRHGTHTIGTVLGEELPTYQVGVAPAAKWIGCRNMDHGNGSVSLYTSCFQFALAPTDVAGNAPNPALAADITNNSWSCESGGEVGCDNPTALITITQALRDAGIMVVSAAGNYGNNGVCSTVKYAPGMLDQSFAVGNIDSGNFIAATSSRGPSSLTGNIKPNISAPGTGVLSALYTGGYFMGIGTSMASPHVAGVAALVMSAAPGLRGQVDEVETLLEKTATPLVVAESCGGVSGYSIPNNTFGYGLVNAQAAVSEALKAVITATIGLSSNIAVPVSVTFEMSVTNTSAVTLTDAQVSAAVPAGLVFNVASDGGLFDGSRITWGLGNLPPHASASVRFTGTAMLSGTLTLSDYRVSFAGMIAPSAGRGQPVMAHVPGLYKKLYLPIMRRSF